VFYEVNVEKSICESSHFQLLHISSTSSTSNLEIEVQEPLYKHYHLSYDKVRYLGLRVHSIDFATSIYLFYGH
jgi:hypothetical protein